MDNQHLNEEPRQQRRMNPNAVHNYKTLSLRLNAWEYERLATATTETGRTKLCFVRWAIRKQAEEVL